MTANQIRDMIAPFFSGDAGQAMLDLNISFFKNGSDYVNQLPNDRYSYLTGFASLPVEEKFETILHISADVFILADDVIMSV